MSRHLSEAPAKAAPIDGAGKKALVQVAEATNQGAARARVRR